MEPDVHNRVQFEFVALTLNLASPQPTTFNLS